MNRTKIPWATHVWNFITGCEPISEGCKNCYAKAIAHRFKQDFKPRIDFDKVLTPFPKKPAIIFVNSVSDLFIAPGSYSFSDGIGIAFKRMIDAPKHKFIILTKRPHLIPAALPRRNNIWIGVSVEDRSSADRIKTLNRLWPGNKLVSFEPLLEEVIPALEPMEISEVKWIIAGGETGPGSRRCEGYWIRDLNGMAQVWSKPFFFKSWGDNPGKFDWRSEWRQRIQKIRQFPWKEAHEKNLRNV